MNDNGNDNLNKDEGFKEVDGMEEVNYEKIDGFEKVEGLKEVEGFKEAEEKEEIEESEQEKSESNRNDGFYSWKSDSYSYVKPRKHKGFKALAACTLILLVACIVLAVSLVMKNSEEPHNEKSEAVSEGVINTPSQGDTSTQRETSYPQSEEISIHPSEGESSTFSQLYKKVAPACCTVVNEKAGAFGSGFVVDSENGYLVTNYHVIENGGDTFKAEFYNGQTYDAALVAGDSLVDIAVLKIEAEGLTAIEIGDSSKANVGDEVFAVGTPYNRNLAGTMTNGIISGLDRKIDITNSRGAVVKTMTMIQTNTTINSGNSGGPLVNMQGQVIGINTIKVSGSMFSSSTYENLGFSIPMSYAVGAINDLIKYGEVRDDTGLVKAPAKLNIQGANVSDILSDAMYVAYYDLPKDLPEGVLVTTIYRNTSIYKAGLEVFDIITEFEGKPIASLNDLSKILEGYKAGQSISIKIYRMNRREGGGEYHDINFTLESAMSD